MIKKSVVLILGIVAMVTGGSAAEKDNIAMFPQAKEGYVRYAIEVPKTENDYDHKLELFIGKNRMVDCNHQSYYGDIDEVTLKGWGYTYLEVKHIDEGATTMMACSQPKVEKFIVLRDPKKTLRRYNSRLPLVVYVPKGFEVKYRVWSASDDSEEAVER